MTVALADIDGLYISGCVFSSDDESDLGKGNTGVCFIAWKWGSQD